MVHQVLVMLSKAALSRVDKQKATRTAAAAAGALANRNGHNGLTRVAAIMAEVLEPVGQTQPPGAAYPVQAPQSQGSSGPPPTAPFSAGSPACIASKELSTRAWIEMESFGGHHVMLQVTNVKAALLNVSGPGNYKGYYEITPVPVGVLVSLLDDEGSRVPVTFTRLAGRPGFTTVKVEIWDAIRTDLPTLAPYQANPFK